jgi:hypothetical protein
MLDLLYTIVGPPAFVCGPHAHITLQLIFVHLPDSDIPTTPQPSRNTTLYQTPGSLPVFRFDFFDPSSSRALFLSNVTSGIDGF